MVRSSRLFTAIAVAAALSLSGGAAAVASVTSTPAVAVPKLNHVFLIMEENNGFSDVIGNPAAPNLNYLAKTFGLETDYFGVSPDSSESNYVGLLGGSTLGVTSDDAYWQNTVTAPDLISQLDKAGVSWKAYLQALPYAGYEGICYPAKCNGSPDSDPLYVSKHDGIQNFTTSRTTADWARQAPIGELGSDLASGAVPSFSYIVPDECHDMHGDPPTPLRPPEPLGTSPSTASASGWTTQQTRTLGANDNSLGAIAAASPSDVWAFGNYLPDAKNSNQDATLGFAEHYDGSSWKVSRTPNAGVNFNSFYGGAAAGGEAWAVGEYLNGSYQDRALLDVWNGKAWSRASIPQPGSVRDMLFGAAALSPDDVWAVGQQLGAAFPDNGLVEHWDGHSWSVVALPSAVSQSVLLDGLTVAPGGTVYAVGEADSTAGGRPLILVYSGGAWQQASIPASAGSVWTNLYGVAIASGRIWVVGTYVDPTTDNNNVLYLSGTGTTFTVAPAPDPGSGSNIVGGITAAGGHLWTAGVYDDGNQRIPLIAHM